MADVDLMASSGIDVDLFAIYNGERGASSSDEEKADGGGEEILLTVPESATAAHIDNTGDANADGPFRSAGGKRKKKRASARAKARAARGAGAKAADAGAEEEAGAGAEAEAKEEAGAEAQRKVSWADDRSEEEDDPVYMAAFGGAERSGAAVRMGATKRAPTKPPPTKPPATKPKAAAPAKGIAPAAPKPVARAIAKAAVKQAMKMTAADRGSRGTAKATSTGSTGGAGAGAGTAEGAPKRAATRALRVPDFTPPDVPQSVLEEMSAMVAVAPPDEEVAFGDLDKPVCLISSCTQVGSRFCSYHCVEYCGHGCHVVRTSSGGAQSKRLTKTCEHNRACFWTLCRQQLRSGFCNSDLCWHLHETKENLRRIRIARGYLKEEEGEEEKGPRVCPQILTCGACSYERAYLAKIEKQKRAAMLAGRTYYSPAGSIKCIHWHPEHGNDQDMTYVQKRRQQVFRRRCLPEGLLIPESWEEYLEGEHAVPALMRQMYLALRGWWWRKWFEYYSSAKPRNPVVDRITWSREDQASFQKDFIDPMDTKIRTIIARGGDIRTEDLSLTTSDEAHVDEEAAAEDEDEDEAAGAAGTDVHGGDAAGAAGTDVHGGDAGVPKDQGEKPDVHGGDAGVPKDQGEKPVFRGWAPTYARAVQAMAPFQAVPQMQAVPPEQVQAWFAMMQAMHGHPFPADQRERMMLERERAIHRREQELKDREIQALTRRLESLERSFGAAPADTAKDDPAPAAQSPGDLDSLTAAYDARTYGYASAQAVPRDVRAYYDAREFEYHEMMQRAYSQNSGAAGTAHLHEGARAALPPGMPPLPQHRFNGSQ
jgi:hypothetical protein